MANRRCELRLRGIHGCIYRLAVATLVIQPVAICCKGGIDLLDLVERAGTLFKDLSFGNSRVRLSGRHRSTGPLRMPRGCHVSLEIPTSPGIRLTHARSRARLLTHNFNHRSSEVPLSFSVIAVSMKWSDSYAEVWSRGVFKSVSPFITSVPS